MSPQVHGFTGQRVGSILAFKTIKASKAKSALAFSSLGEKTNALLTYFGRTSSRILFKLAAEEEDVTVAECIRHFRHIHSLLHQ